MKTKKRKLLTTLLLTAALAFSIVSTPFADAFVTASAASTATDPNAVREIPVTYMDSFVENYLGDNALKEDVAKDYGHKSDKVAYTYQFTLDKASYVNICAVAKVFAYNFYGDYELYLSTSKDQFTKKIADEFADGTKQTNYIMSLEPGTYYLQLALVPDGYAFMDGAYTYVNVIAQPLTARTGNVLGSSMENAIPVTKNVPANGAITGMDKNRSVVMESNSVQQQYFKIDLPNASKLSLSLVASRCFGITTFSNYSLTMHLLDTSGRDLKAFDNGYGYHNSITATTDVLPKGTYYVKVSYPGHCEMTLTADYTGSANKAIKTLKVTAKKNKKKITVTSVKNASVKIKIGKKTYKGKTNKKGTAVIKTAKLKKGTTVKVTVSKSGYQSKTKKVKIK